MNNIKRTALGLLVAVLAFGFSAFTTYKKRTILVYYKTSLMYPNPTDPRGYTYYNNDICEAGGNICSAQWDIGYNAIPYQDGEPLSTTGVTFQTGSVVTGHAEY